MKKSEKLIGCSLLLTHHSSLFSNPNHELISEEVSLIGTGNCTLQPTARDTKLERANFFEISSFWLILARFG